MRFKQILLICSIFLILTGFTVIDANYYTYQEPSWVWRQQTGDAVYKYKEIKTKVDVAIQKLEKKGLNMEDVKIYISPRSYGVSKGMTWKNEIVIAENSFNIIYHELGHVYDHKHKGLIEKYAKDMKTYYPNIEINKPPFGDWDTNIKEDFAEEFRLIFTGGEKKTLYPPFPNFYEWLLRNTQPIEITREEVFNKLGGADKLISEGVIIGDENGNYMLSKPITRGEVATVLVRLKGYNKEKQVPFTDINNQWYSSYVRKIYNEGLIKGLPNNTFAGDKLITRYELHMILERFE